MSVLGPLRVIGADGCDLTPDGVLQRRLLALLVANRGRVVRADAAIEALWSASLPRDPSGALQNHLSRLRKGLPDGLIESLGDGYRLDPALVEVDCDRLAALVSDSSAPSEQVELDSLIDRWRGPAYPELVDLDEGRAESERLAELRARAIELGAERRLARGDTDGLVTELSALVDEHPLRERPRALLMGALAVLGRQAEALRVYDDLRRRLGEELGIEPSRALAAQHAELLVGATAESERPAGRTMPGRLPVPLTAIVGRGTLATELTDLASTQRLVTLVGPGGVGKTRLLLEVGHRLQADRVDRAVVFCELAAADDATATAVVAQALGIDARPDVPLVERISGVVGDDEVVVLVDNCEHVLEAAVQLVDHLLSRCPNLSMVATSRERLRLPGEQVRVVPTLPVTDDGSAVQLFMERARAVVPGFAPAGDDLACVAEIVRRLDGLPLAIELAAARLHTHSLGEVAAGLDRRFSLLAAGHRGASRHASLGAVVSWSFDQLDERMRHTFAALSVFAGPFGVPDAAAVCGLDRSAAEGALAELTERSLVMRIPEHGFLLLETLRAYGAEQLAASGGEGDARRRHARHFVDWATEADRRLMDPGHGSIGDIDARVPELQSALDNLLDHGEVEQAGRLVTALLDYGLLRLRPDVLGWSNRVTAADPHDLSPHASRLWVAAAYAAWMGGDTTATGAHSTRALEVAERTGLPVPPEVATMCGSHALFEGRLDDAVRWYHRAVELAATAGDEAQRVMTTGSEILALGYAGDERAASLAETVLAEIDGSTTPYAAYVWYCAAEADLTIAPERAPSRFARALEAAEATGASFVTGIAGASMASIVARSGDPAAAVQEYRWLIDHWRRAGMWSTQWTMLRSIALLMVRLGRPRESAVLMGAIRATGAGHRIFGADEVALHDLSLDLRAALGDDLYESALAEGAALDGDAAVEHALRVL